MQPTDLLIPALFGAGFLNFCVLLLSQTMRQTFASGLVSFSLIGEALYLTERTPWLWVGVVHLALWVVAITVSKSLEKQPRVASRFDESAVLNAQYLFGTAIALMAAGFVQDIPQWVLQQFGRTPCEGYQGALKGPVDFGLICIVAELVYYGFHRAMHRVPLLWRVHSVHHSLERIDAMGAARVHLAELLLGRMLLGTVFLVAGFSSSAIMTYVVLSFVYGVVNHANTRAVLPVWLESLITSPRFHHWHHARDPKLHHANFSNYFCVVDRIFGTFVLPAGWPEQYGVVETVRGKNYVAHQIMAMVPVATDRPQKSISPIL